MEGKKAKLRSIRVDKEKKDLGNELAIEKKTKLNHLNTRLADIQG